MCLESIQRTDKEFGEIKEEEFEALKRLGGDKAPGQNDLSAAF